MRIVKRYSNRKLYDTEVRHYVTLSDLAQSIRNGVDLEVRDHVNGSDLTAQTLAQIIFEEEKKSPRVGAVETFTQIIRFGLDDKK